jgi:hypothetical protein
VVPANYFVQGIPVAPGDHVVRLKYRDPDIATGAIGSGIAVMVLLLGAAVAGLIERRVSK